MIAKFTAWLLDVIIRGLKALLDVFNDIAIKITEGVLQAIAALIKAIPVPSFLSNSSLSSIFQQLHPDILYFVGQLGITEAFVVLGAGFAFRMARKVFTLGQW